MSRKGKARIIPESPTPAESKLASPLTKIDGDSKLLSVLVATVFVLLFSFLTISSFLQKSPTVDEPIHLFAGYSYLKLGDFRANPEHPPLAKLWAALPLLALDINDSWQFNMHWDLIPQYPPHLFHVDAVAAEMLFQDNDANRLFFYAKLQMIALGILLGLFVYRWSKELYGLEAGIAALGIYCLDPNMLAHSQIVHTDMPFAAVFFIGTYFFWRALRKLNWSNLILAAVFFGLAAVTKYVYPEVLLVWGLLGLLKIFSSRPQRCDIGSPREVSSRWGKAALLALLLVCSLVTAYLFIWLIYRFRFDAVPGGNFHFPMALELTRKSYLQELAAFLIRHHLFPEAWIYGQLYVLNHLQRNAYLLGLFSEHGFWLYFPIAFAVKTPVPTLLLFVATLVPWIFRRRDRAGGFLFVPVVVCFALAVFSPLDIGLRHILQIYPFLFVLIGGTAAELWKDRSRLKRGVLVFLALWYLGSSISIYPHYLAYFNEIAGGAKNGYKVLLDSNLDWGQDLRGLKKWMDQNGVKKIQFMYFGFHNIAAPRYYGIDAIYLPGSWASDDSSIHQGSQVPNYLAVNANHLFGYFRRERRENFVQPFKSLRPIAVIGYSIFIYRISDAIEQLRTAIKTSPNSAKSHAELGSLLENQGEAANAMEEYRRAISLDPGSLNALYNLGILLVRRGELTEGVQYLRKAAEVDPTDTDIHYDLAVALAVDGDFEEAIERLRETINADPNYTKAHYNLGMLLAGRGEREQAIKELEMAVYLDPTYSKAHYQLGQMLADRGRTEEAVSQFLQALQIEPEFVEAHESVGRALMLLGRKDEALKHLEEAVRIIKSRPTSTLR